MDNNEDDDGNDEVILGPDLNPSRSEMDKKLYRHITLANGMKCVLISDTVAMRQRKLDGYYDDSSDDDESESGEDEDGVSDDDSDDDEDDDDDDDDDDGLRKAATALLVNVGSYHDPPHIQGLSHFLEHMLFLGTESYPVENAYDSFLSQQGGSDNAYTEMEHTLYHYCIPQDGSSGEKNVWKALEMFCSFFKCPLLSKDGAERELNAVESEFELNKKDDGCRLSQVMNFTCGMDGNAPLMGREFSNGAEKDDSCKKPFHPFAKFPWGNMKSLKTEPESNGVDIMKELRDHYHRHYYARNMRLVVMAGYELDEIQRRVVQHFKDVPANPRVSSGTVNNAESGITNLYPYKLPFHASSLSKVYRIIPVRNHHTLTLTWQMPSISNLWRTKPHDYLGHLLGHEASGSILANLKERGWAMCLSAGTGEDGEGDASTHALFGLQISLSKVGMKHWEDVVKIVFSYIGMLKFNYLKGHADENGKEKEGLEPFIYDELKSIAELSYRYAEEGDVTDIVEEVAENMAPWYNMPEERLLDGVELLFEDGIDNQKVKSLLFDYFTPENTRIDLMSSLFGRDQDFEDSTLEREEEKKDDAEDGAAIQPMEIDHVDGNESDGSEDPLLFDKKMTGPPSIEPRFGTKFFVDKISNDMISQWTDAAKPQLHSESAIGLPPKNSYIPTEFDLKSLPSDDSDHPLINCSVKVQITVGKKKDWFPAAVTKCKTENSAHRLSLTYEDEGEKWHVLDDAEAYSKFEGEQDLESGHEGTLDGGQIKFRVSAVPREGKGIVFSYGDSGHDDDVENGVAFPPIPPPAPASRLPLLVYNKHSLKVWHLHDRKFKRPTADLRLKVVCEGMNDSALNQACMSLFCCLCADALTETCYLASVCDLDSALYPTGTGFSIRVHGYDHRLLCLAEEVLKVAFAFRRDGEFELPSIIKDGRFDACLEVQRRKYSNAGMDASSFSTSLRLLCLQPSVRSSFLKLKALHGITVTKFVDVMNRLKRLSVEAFYHGNVDRKNADDAANVIERALTCHHIALPKKKLPTKLVIKMKNAIDHPCSKVVAPTIDSKDPNTAVEVYFQFGNDDNSEGAVQHRVLTDLLEHILEEPLYNQIRTKEQFGYEVSCGSRWTYGVLGMSFRIVTSCKSADESSSRIDSFLKSFRSELEMMSGQTFMEHLVGLAKQKLEGFDSMEEETSHFWSEVIEGRYDFDAYRKEVHCLRSISKDQLLAVYDQWLNPFCRQGKPKKRRRLVLHVIGSGNGTASLGRPAVKNEKAIGDEIDLLVQNFHSVNTENWGR